MHNIEKNLARVNQRISETCDKFGRNIDDITLLAVSKKKTVSDILAALQAGQKDFGESYAQEAEGKIDQINDPAITWHFIGPIQSNKTRIISHRFDWVHSVDRLKIAQRLSDARPAQLPALNVLLQVNIDHDPAKSGIDPAQITGLADAVARLPRLKLRGLMAIPAMHESFDQQRQPFARMRQAFETLQQSHPDCDTLSMGMSDDMCAAIAEGSTLVRIGTAIFGPREN
jgi:pyridoxal phosphate enzyme (YggS family)